MAIETDIALAVLQLIALAIPPVAVLIKMLRQSENLNWQFRRASFGLAISSMLLFITSGAAVLAFFYTNYAVGLLIQVALAATVAGLVPFALFTGVLYKEHKAEFGD
jgi:Flp pilus assembly protein TadB